MASPSPFARSLDVNINDDAACHVLFADAVEAGSRIRGSSKKAEAEVAAEAERKWTLDGLGELRRECAALPDPPKVFHYRSAGGVEVDFVIEDPAGRCVGAEVKASSSLSDKHFNSLRDLEAGLGKQFHCGAVLYGGSEQARFGERLWAVPMESA